MPFGPYFADLPVDSGGYAYVDQAKWDQLLGNFTVWKDHVSAAGKNLSNVGQLTFAAGGGITGAAPFTDLVKGPNVSNNNASEVNGGLKLSQLYSIYVLDGYSSTLKGATWSKDDYAPYSYRWGKHTNGGVLKSDGTNFTQLMELTNAGALSIIGAFTTASVAATGAVTAASVAATGAVTSASVTATGPVMAPSLRTSSAFGEVRMMQDANIGFRWTLNNDGTLRLQRTANAFSAATAPLYFDASDNVGLGSAWNSGHLLMGGFHLWVDSSGRLRIKIGAPASETDGVVVGSQS